jgi:3-oxoacyl-[acyl-carrier-protein] synthase-1
MESLAIHDAGLTEVPVNSFKGAFGHTLGAAGVIESVLAVESMKRNRLLPSTGYETGGVTYPINVIKSPADARLMHVLKTASGFGGCNAAVVFSKR